MTSGTAMRVFGLAGWSSSGKTTLLTRLIPQLTSCGLTVSTVKHAHHDFDIDQPGKDSWHHREAGATEVLVTSARRWALMHEHRGAAEPSLAELTRHMTPVDLLLIEGFKHHPHPKLEVYRSALGKPLLCREDPHILAIASDEPLADLGGLPRFDLDDVAAIAHFIIDRSSLALSGSD